MSGRTLKRKSDMMRSHFPASISEWLTQLGRVLVAAFAVALTLQPVTAGASHSQNPTHFQDVYCDTLGEYSMSSWSRSQARNYASIGMGEGYQWGGGCWNDNDTDDQPGDPTKQTSTEGEGGDCSGFTFKSWALKNGSSGYMYWPALNEEHGDYNTTAFAAGTPSDVSVISKSSTVYMDAFVKGGSHMGMIYTLGTSSGVDYIIEAKGESPGTDVWLRSYRGDTAYKGIRRAGFSTSTEMTWFLRYSNSGGATDEEIIFGDTSATMVTGDWNGDGRSSPGTFKNGAWVLQSSDGTPDITFTFGSSGETPVTGDWDGNGEDTIGTVSSAGNWELRNTNSGGSPDEDFYFGAPGDSWVTGDWDADGETTIGLVRGAGHWYIRNTNSTGVADDDFFYGISGDSWVTGDWDGDGETTIGIVRGGGHWYLRNTNSTGPSDLDFWHGAPGDIWVTGDWTGDDDTTVGIVR